MDQIFEIDHVAEKKLGKYVYGLIDPRDRKVFYVGQGIRNRVGGHFDEAREAIIGQREFSSKLRRIQDIWDNGLNVEVQIIRHGLHTNSEADHVEGACIALLGLSQNGIPYNLNLGPRSVQHGAMSVEDIEMLNAPAVNPSQSIGQVFIFNSNSESMDTDEVYNSVRGDWSVSAEHRGKLPAYAVALSRGVSKAVFKVDGWEPSGDKYRFIKCAPDASCGELVVKNWSAIIGITIGYWMRGQYLIVDFNGNGTFTFIRGSSIKEPIKLY
nr:hypothetical protein [uncultured Hyphomonas sp.]